MKSITFFVLNICSTLILLSHCEDNSLYSFDIVNETSWIKIAKKIFKEKSPSNFTIIPFNKENSDDNESGKEESILLIRKKIKPNNGNAIIPGDSNSDDINDFSLNFTPNQFSDKNEDIEDNPEYPTTSYKPSDDLNSNSSFIEESEKAETELESDSENKNKDINISSNLEENNTMNESDKIDSKYELTGNEKCDNSMKLGNLSNYTNQETINKSLSVGETFCIDFEGNAGTGYIWVLLGIHKDEPAINPEEFPKKLIKKPFFSEEISVTQPKKFKINEHNSSKNVGDGNNASEQNENDSKEPKKPKMHILGGPEPVRSVIKAHKPGKYYIVYSYYRPFSPESGANTKILNVTVQ
ncbi:inhibitor of cysteine proteases, putative [Plasmodium vinckei vinckei]|uniref:Inhibitor of cysteine proteases, putative n=1 Tax=Plasmodium vinckei vinckei TaxID=54757 RepID=A0A449BTP7_PLAVN|nr:inhibitor of cysteine proteases, putative [Plasmodium vinckei vinckei]VEV56805.1 inhibitor of cysteine proteases, putative [Plasmodium vinckei vinckei]